MDFRTDGRCPGPCGEGTRWRRSQPRAPSREFIAVLRAATSSPDSLYVLSMNSRLDEADLERPALDAATVRISAAEGSAILAAADCACAASVAYRRY